MLIHVIILMYSREYHPLCFSSMCEWDSRNWQLLLYIDYISYHFFKIFNRLLMILTCLDPESHILFFDIEGLIVELLSEEYSAMSPASLEVCYIYFFYIYADFSIKLFCRFFSGLILYLDYLFEKNFPWNKLFI